VEERFKVSQQIVDMSTKLETLDFSQSASDMVALDKPAGPMPESSREAANVNYHEQRENFEKNNIDKEQMMELSTPLNEIMDQPMDQPPQMPQPQQMMAATPQEMESPPQNHQQQRVSRQNPGGLSDEQMDALIVAAAAAVAFSPQVKERMTQYVPSLFTEGGSRTLGGTVATGLVAAGVFYGVKKFVLKN
tara:strand:- start:21948 stop:22520 length:573 start_codon:yes stop_codon:yes gene_type:complete